jgi:hypothetical protein
MTPWQQLIERYAGGREICNCRSAYYTNCGEAYVNGKFINDYPTCQYGCSSNQITARDYIAQRILEDLPSNKLGDDNGKP